MPKLPARRIPVMITLAVLVGVGSASIPAPARASDGPITVPVSPVDGALFDVGDLEFVWTEPRDATGYELRSGLDGRVDPKGALVDAPSTTTLLTVTPVLVVNGLPEGTYYWQVRARDAAGEPGSWSDVREVTVDLPGEGGGLQLETLALDDYVIEQAPLAPTVVSGGPGGVGLVSILIAGLFSVLLLSVVVRRAVTVRVRS
ncbi:hypothetical protein [Pseudolysinimonas sp.]|uniref:hypothetical protein n=1 Tax=Pseudolysinimonas sp. TaxID=2680009 RepID=UPI00286A03C9|nr:hypothetical protein [Pseudolysinimonas sp.]